MELSFISQIQQFVKLDEETALVHKWLNQIISKTESRKILFLATEFKIYLFFKTEGLNKLNLESSYKLCDLKRGENVGKLMFRLTFKNSRLTFSEESPTHILDIISVHLRSLLLPREFPRIDSEIGPDSPSTISYKLIIRRYRAKMKWNELIPTLKMIEGIQRFIESEPTKVDLGLIEDLGIDIKYFLESIEIQPLITCIIVPNRIESNFWNHLSQFMSKNSSIRKIIIPEQFDNNGFKQFCFSISKNFSSGLYYLEFFDIFLNDESINSIWILLSQHPLTSLSFIRCTFGKYFQNFFNLVQKTSSVGQLLGLSMTSMNFSLNFDLFNSILNLTQLSLRGCGIQISTIFDLLTINNNKLTLLDLTHNRCTEPLRNHLKMPNLLTKLILDDVVWNYHNLYSIFNASVNAIQNFTLSVARVFLDKTGWDRFFDSVETLPAPCLEGLIWRENPITSKFCSFLIKCPVLDRKSTRLNSSHTATL